MPPLLRTYFNPSHRSFLQTLFATTFLVSLSIAAFPCPVDRSARKISNDSEGDEEETNAVSGNGQTRQMQTDKRKKNGSEIVVLMNERSGGKRRFIMED